MALGTFFGLSMAKKEAFLKGNKEDAQNVEINTNSDSLYVDMKQVTIPQNFIGYDDDIYSDKKMVFEEDYPSVDVTRKSDITTPYLIIKKEGKGYNVPINLTVPVEIQGNKILLPNFMKYPYSERFRNYNVNYELVIPKNTRVFAVRDNFINLDDDVDNDGEKDDNSNGVVISKNQIKINGSTIQYNENDKDSVIINGKKVPKSDAEAIMDSMKTDLKNLKNIDISINKDKKEVSIKTK